MKDNTHILVVGFGTFGAGSFDPAVLRVYESAREKQIGFPLYGFNGSNFAIKEGR